GQASDAGSECTNGPTDENEKPSLQKSSVDLATELELRTSQDGTASSSLLSKLPFLSLSFLCLSKLLLEVLRISRISLFSSELAFPGFIATPPVRIAFEFQLNELSRGF